MNNLPIRVKMASMYVLITVMTLVIYIVSMATLNGMGETTAHVYEADVQATRHALTAQDALTRQLVGAQGALLAFEDDLTAALRDMEATGEEYSSAIQQLSAVADDGAALSSLVSGSAGLNTIRQGFISAAQSGDRAAAQTALEQMEGFVAEARSDIHAIVADAEEDAALAVQGTLAIPRRMILFYVIYSVIYVFITFLLGHKLANAIAKPVHELERAAARIAQGDIEVELKHEGNDEAGRLTRQFVSMIGSIQEQAQVLGTISAGDYTATIQPRSDSDVVNKAIVQMLDNNNETISKIQEASRQVAAGAEQISAGAQGLASGTSQQAASIQQISATITELQQKAENNSSSAHTALDVTRETGERVGESMESLSQLQKAMTSIDESSRNITKINKVIDDIAFQTNILALNAAVEAARAGQHGKGFAVVADEVRNLAAKSAEAAKQTTELIEGSNQRVREGSRLAEQTGLNMQAMEELALRTLGLIEDIAKESNNQAVAVGELTDGIEQISQVIYSNSATAQQSAASAEEMNAQADVMNHIVDRFKLRDSRGSYAPSRFEDGPEDSLSDQMEFYSAV